MFTSFSGSSRRPRQVNLSGRKSHAFGNTGGGSGSQAALDRAQQERAQRQRERETLKAAQTLQRVWRGHSSRKEVASQLRQDWDDAEGRVVHLNLQGPDSEKLHSVDSATPYASEEEALAQLQGLLKFAKSRKEDDLRRIRHYGGRLRNTVKRLGIQSTGPWPLAYLRLERIVLTALERGSSTSDSHDQEQRALLILLNFLAEQATQETAQNAVQFYHTLAVLVTNLSTRSSGTEILQLVSEIIVIPLKKVTGYTLNAYEAFGHNFLPLPILNSAESTTVVDKFREHLADTINYKLLAHAMATSLKSSGLHSHPMLATLDGRLRFLSCFIYFHRFAHNFRSPEAYSAHKDFVSVVSVMLNSLPVGILLRHMNDSEEQEEVSPFIRKQICSLINQEGVSNLLSSSTVSSDSSEEDRVEEARELANYALALLRFFPGNGDDIRMWLYLGPTSGKSSGSKPAIKYFWEAARRSSVFSTITRDSRAAIELLKSPKPESAVNGVSQGSFWQAPQQQVDRTAVIADEWRVILVFLELYTFILKLMDDEEFFSASKDPFSEKVRDNNLPLDEIKDLTTFLKNLGFTLYFNASDITNDDERDTSSGGLSFYNPRAVETQTQRENIEPSIGGVSGLSLDYVKGLVTGLVRSLYERDSRRKFLPKDHWLMTSRFDMTGFIPSVVQEEESRHRIEEEDAEDKDDDEEEELDATPQLIGTGRTQHQRRLERLQRQQRKASRRRYLQAVAPRLEILQNMPFFIPFATRVQIFREFVSLDMTKRRGGPDTESWRFRVLQHPDARSQLDKHHAKIRREHEFEDAFGQFWELGNGLKEPIQITFVDQFDTAEAGIDGGGVTKEFLTSVTNRAFMPTDFIDMFVTNDQHLLYPNPAAIDELMAALQNAGIRHTSGEFRVQVQQLLQRYEFLGRIIGKCLYEGILVDVNFAHFFLRKWALTGGTNSAPRETGYRPTLNDLKDLDEELYQGLHKLKTYPGDVEDFALNFTVTDTIVIDHTTNPRKTKAITRELVQGGSDMTVTNQNRLLYITYMARHRLQMQPYQQTTKFLQGLSSMINPSWLSMFNAPELQTLISGTSSSIDIADLRRSTLYGGTYVIGDDGLEHPTVQLFWKVMQELSDGEQRAVLKFVTSTPRAPLLGFGTLNPRFSIRDGSSDESRLPSTSTCVNLLKLPMYRDEKTLKEKLLYSVFSGAGFDLS